MRVKLQTNLYVSYLLMIPTSYISVKNYIKIMLDYAKISSNYLKPILWFSVNLKDYLFQEFILTITK